MKIKNILTIALFVAFCSSMQAQNTPTDARQDGYVDRVRSVTSSTYEAVTRNDKMTRGDLLERIETVYNAKGQRKSMTYKSPAEEIMFRTRYKHNGFGLITLEQIVDNEEHVIGRTHYIYNANLALTEYYVEDAENQVETRTTLRYDSQGRMIQRSLNDPLNEVYRKEVFTYTPEGQVLKTVIYNRQNQKIQELRNEYDENQQPTSLTRYDYTEDEPEVQVVDRATGRPFAYVYGGTGPRKCAFDIEWYVGCEPWILALGNVGFAATEELLFTLKDGGVKAFEDAADWRAFDFRASYERHGVPFNIDRGLRRALERAKRGGDANVERTIRALGIGEDRVSDPYTLRVKAQTRKGMLNEIFNLSCDAECGDARKAKLLAYLAEGGDVPSLNNLGYLFHFGMGVKTDYDLAVYWHLRGAEAGDHYSMLSLGKIFSEKNSPRWDGPKAVEWFEKAIASGDDWAKGELGHCLICGRCVETDFERAESLLEEAVEACPDRADFAENLEKARNRESI